MKLTAENVIKIFEDCLFKEDEPTDNHVIGEGIMVKAGFHPERLEKSKQDISDMLDCLPDDFKKSGGGGMSFLNMCMDKEGKQWADLHKTMDMLVMLGNAIGKLSFPIPRILWQTLEGGMPYIIIS